MDEQTLIRKLKDPASRNFAFNQLVREYQQRLYGLIRKMVIDHDDADDLLQDVFVKVYQNIDSFREDAQLYTWLYRIASNECLGFLRKKKRRYMLSLQDMTTELEGKVDHTPGLSGDEIQKKLQKAILQLPEKQRLVFHLKYYEELPYEEIAQITGSSVGGLKANYHHAVKKIEKRLSVG